MTEASHQMASNPLPPARADARLGRGADRHRDRHRRPPTAPLLPEGIAGEVVIRGPGVMSGYVEQPGGQRRGVLRRLVPHRRPRRARDGYLYLEGRLKEMIIRGGENISPAEIEEVLHRASRRCGDAVCFGVPDEKYGETVGGRGDPARRRRPEGAGRPLPRAPGRVQGAGQDLRAGRDPAHRHRQGPAAPGRPSSSRSAPGEAGHEVRRPRRRRDRRLRRRRAGPGRRRRHADRPRPAPGGDAPSAASGCCRRAATSPPARRRPTTWTRSRTPTSCSSRSRPTACRRSRPASARCSPRRGGHLGPERHPLVVLPVARRTARGRPALESVDPGGVIARVDRARTQRRGCVVYCSTEIIEPGVIRHVEGTRFTLGEPDGCAASPRCERSRRPSPPAA